MTAEEIKKCPFCGGKVEIEDISNDEIDDIYFMVQCTNKKCNASICFGDFSISHEMTIKKFNERAR